MKVVEHHSVEELRRLFQRERDARLAKRLWVVWQARIGLTEPQITASAGLSRRQVQEWVRRYNLEGLAGLRDRPGRGRKPILSPEEKQQLSTRVEEGPREDDVCSLRGLDVQAFIEQQFGKRMSLAAVYLLLHELGYSWLVPRPKHRKSDPAAVEAFKKKFPTNWRRPKPLIQKKNSSCSSKTSAASDSKVR